MALFRDDSDKTEPATPRRREEARRKGQVALSQELTMAFLLLASAALLAGLGGGLLQALGRSVAQGAALAFTLPEDPVAAAGAFLEAARPAAGWVLSFVAVLAAVALLTSYGQVGVRFAPSRVAPKLSKINPIRGLERMLRGDGLFRLGHAVLKLSALGGVLVLVLLGSRERLAGMAELPVADSARIVASTVLLVLWWTAAILIIIAFADVAWQRWRHEKSLRMSRKEVDDERKRMEGDPHVKARIRRAQREMARRRMLAEVPRADVVITNPVHFAVALRYAKARMNAPVVTAKGTDRTALRMRELAKASGVPVMEDPPLARALHAGVEPGEEIPPRFYQAVAAVLSHVWRMRGRQAS